MTRAAPMQAGRPAPGTPRRGPARPRTRRIDRAGRGTGAARPFRQACRRPAPAAAPVPGGVREGSAFPAGIRRAAPPGRAQPYRSHA